MSEQKKIFFIAFPTISEKFDDHSQSGYVENCPLPFQLRSSRKGRNYEMMGMGMIFFCESDVSCDVKRSHFGAFKRKSQE